MAQNYANNWEEYYSYFHITDLDYGNGRIYAATENAVFTTQIGNDIQKKITTLDGLSGEQISALHYSEAYNTLLIGYENGLIQLYNLSEETTKTFIDIIDKSTIPPNKKHINDFFEIGNKAYIATNYGISVFNLTQKEFGDTYYIGNNGDQLAVNAVTLFNNQIFAATQGAGIRYTNINNPNIIDYTEWHQIDQGDYADIFTFQNQLFALNNNNTLKQVNATSLSQVFQFGQNVQDLKVSQNYITVTLPTKIKVFNNQLQLLTDFTTNQISPNFNTGLTYQGVIYAGDSEYGLIKTALNNPLGIDFLSPNGPLRNDIFAMDIAPSELWVAYGEYNYYYNPYPLTKRGLSHLTKNHWINIPYAALPEDKSIVNVTINPHHTDQVFFGSYHDGLLEIENNEINNFYTPNNSNLDGTEGSSSIRIGPGAFDNQGNLWLANALSTDGLLKFPSGGGANSFVKYDITDVINNTENNNGFGDIVIDNTGNIYLATMRDGVVGFEPSSHTFSKIKGGKNNGNLPDNYVQSLAIDDNNQLWIGTKKGLRVLYGPAVMFQNPNVKAKNIVFLDDDGVAQELFSGLSISAIEVDGNNNKWVGSTAGVYYVSSDGQKTYHHYTTDNSPLPSNNVNSIKIDGTTGKVYIATQKGLVAYSGKATSAENDLNHVRAFPNPVRPNYSGMVTIDGLMKNVDVKITDIEGNLVYEEVSKGGSIQWDTSAFGKYKVASGVYLVMITSDDQAKTKITKIMIIR